MRIFLTGATGFIGSALVPELIKAGHQVVGVTRSDAGAEALAAAGAEVHRGTLEDPEGLRDGAAKAEAVIHTAFDHDFSRFAENCEKDKRVISALGAALAGSDRPLVITSGVGMGSPGHGQLAIEDVFNTGHPNPRIASELAGNALLEAGVNVSVVRLPQVHNPVKQGLISPLIEIAREKGVSAYVGEGRNRFSAGRRGAGLPACGGKAAAGRSLSRGRRGRCRRACHRRGAWPGSEIASRFHRAGKGGGAFRLDGDVRADGPAGLQRADTGTAGLASDRPDADRRSRRHAICRLTG